MKWTDVEIAWMAGLLEGEGTFYATRRARMIKCSMTDQDVIDRLHAVSRVGTVHATCVREGRKAAWTWQVGKASEQLPLLTALRPHMGQRRGAKIDEFLELLESLMTRTTCVVCGATIENFARALKYCSNECRIKAFNDKHPDYVRPSLVGKTRPPGWTPGGAANGHAKLTEAQALDILRRYTVGGVTQAQLAEEYSVLPSTVNALVNRKTWKNLTL